MLQKLQRAQFFAKMSVVVSLMMCHQCIFSDVCPPRLQTHNQVISALFSYVEGGVNTNCQRFLHAQTFQVTDLCHNLVNLIQFNVVLT